MAVRPASHYDRDYFDKWYRSTKHRVKSPLDIARQLRFVVSAAEYILERPLRTVLDVGAGEGHWGVALKKIRRGARYVGVDPSEYAVGRFGEKRGLKLGGFGTLSRMRLPDTCDLILSCGVMNYVSPEDLESGLAHLTRLSVGVAYFEVFTSADDATGDFSRAAARQPAWWRRLFDRTGWEPLGLHFYVRKDMASMAAALERAR